MRPRALWREVMLYGLQNFGQMTAVKFVNKTNLIMARLEQHPKIGHPEPLLKHRKALYRSLHLLPHVILIYRYYESSDTIRVVDIWDTRRNPDKLVQRLK